MTANYEVTAHRAYSNADVSIKVWVPETMKVEADLAARLIEKWGMVAATETNDEDSAGRAKLRLQTPEEVVSRACRTAELAFAEFRARGWVVPLPSPSEAQELMQHKD